jgi:hypothetical protein
MEHPFDSMDYLNHATSRDANDGRVTTSLQQAMNAPLSETSDSEDDGIHGDHLPYDDESDLDMADEELGLGPDDYPSIGHLRGRRRPAREITCSFGTCSLSLFPVILTP